MFVFPRHEFSPPRGRPVKYPIGMLRVGESVFFAGTSARNIKDAARCHRPKIFECHTVFKDGVRGVQVTRVLQRSTSSRGGRLPKYPFRSLAVGESIYVRGLNAADVRDYWRSIKGAKFKSKTVMRGGEIGTRVWRIA